MFPDYRKPLLHNRRGGFSLLELAVVVSIVAVMAGTGMAIGKSTMDSAQVAMTNTRMQTIQTALKAFRRANDRLPCPANATILAGNANYGVESANAGNCTGGTPAANYSVGSSGTLIVEGSLPTRALSLPDEFMYDGWGRKFVYTVWASATGGGAFTNYGISSNCGLITIRNSAGISRSDNSLYVLMSLGPNGHGAYNEMGLHISAGSANASEQINCHCNSSGADTGFAGTYIQRDYTENAANSLDKFDDIVLFQERWQLQNYFDEYNPGGHLLCPSLGVGLRTYGLAANDNAGYSVAMGDVNGDGIQDLIIGLPRTGTGSPGSVAVIFGKATGLTNPFVLGGLDGTNGVMINSSEASDWAGAAVTTGDFNGDRIADVVIGAPHGNGTAGRVYVVFGHSNSWGASFALNTLDGTNGFVVNNNLGAGQHYGSSVAASSIVADGDATLAVGAPNVGGDDGAVYVSQWLSTTYAASYNVSSYKNDFVSCGGCTDRMGTSVAMADVNGDGIKDLIIGAPSDGSKTGYVSVALGSRVGGATNFAGGMNMFRLVGENVGDLFGQSVATGDINGNNISDILIGAPGWTSNKGAGYVYFGNSAGIIPTIAASTFNGTNGFRLSGVAANDLAGTAVAIADLNGDGYGDPIIGAPGASPGGLAGAGTSYVTFGGTSWSANFNLSTLNGTNGFLLNGSTAGDNSGRAFAVGDLNRDYTADLVLGVPLADYSFANSGAAYLFYGQKKPTPWSLTVDLNTM